MAVLGKLCPQLPCVSLQGDSAGRPPHTSHRALTQHGSCSTPHTPAPSLPSHSANPHQPPSAVIRNHHIPRNEQPGSTSPSLSKALLSQCHWET